MRIRSILHRTARTTPSRARSGISIEQALARATSTTQRDELLYLRSSR